MKKRTALSLAISMAISYPGALNALGLGELQSSSQLNQPLSAQINLLSTNAKEAKQLQVKLASADVFSRVGIDRPAYLDSLNFRTAIRNGKPVILVSSDKPVKEPFLNFLLEVSWPQGQLLKEYTVLLDPPILVQSGTSTPDTAASVRAEPQSSGVVKRTDNAAAQQNQQQAQQRRLQQQQQQQTAERRVFDEQAKLAMRKEGTVPRAVRSAGSSKKYRVKSGDTMYKVASNLRYRGTTNNQMMIALFKANPHAFGNDNINHLNVGKVLVRPSLGEVKDSSRSAAKKLVKQHYAAWQKYRSGLATTATAQTQTAEPASNKTPNKSSTTIPKQVSSANKPNLTVVGSGAESTSKNGGTASAALQKKLLLAEEALASSKSKNIELESRVSKLEAIVRKKDRLITLKNERLARLESQMGGEGVAAIQPASINPVESEGIDLAGQVGNEIDQGNDTILRGSEPTTGEPVVVEKMPEIEAPEVEAASVAPTEVEPAEVASTDMANADSERLASPFVSDVKDQSGNGLLELLKSPLVAAIGGGSLLALILGGLFLRRRQTLVDTDEGFSDTTDEDFDVIEDDLDTDTDFDDDFDTTLSDYQSDDSNEGDELDKVLSSDSSLEDDEALQEADVYIVYGLHEQAEDELKKAIKEKPEKLEYRYKLLENYQVADDAESFVAGAKDFLKTEGDNKQELWDKILDLGKKIAPENDMFSEKSATKAASVFAGVAALGAVAATTGDTATNPVSTNDFESMLNDNSGLDDLDLSGIDNDDFNFDADTNTNLDVAGIDANVKDDLDLSEFLDSDDTEFQSNFDLDDLDNLETDNSNVLNFNADSGKDLTSLNLELDTDSGIDKVLPAGGTYGSGQGDSGEEDALSFLNLPGDDQEMQDAHIGTKLDLARAYLDMGDVEGARCTLEEVVVEGNDAQKREAQEMLQQTG